MYAFTSVDPVIFEWGSKRVLSKNKKRILEGGGVGSKSILGKKMSYFNKMTIETRGTRPPELNFPPGSATDLSMLLMKHSFGHYV